VRIGEFWCDVKLAQSSHADLVNVNMIAQFRYSVNSYAYTGIIFLPLFVYQHGCMPLLARFTWMNHDFAWGLTNQKANPSDCVTSL